jgi:U3 small nucleolar RNA-associated protein 16
MSTPLRKKVFKDSDSDTEFVTPASNEKSLHKKFGENEHSVLRMKSRNDSNLNNISENSSDNSDDDAPEEESLSAAKTASEVQEKHFKLKLIEENKIIKQQRRLRDQRLKDQKQDSKKRLLPDDILEKAEKEAEQALLSRDGQGLPQTLIANRVNGKPSHKRLDKTVFKKGPVTVKVLQNNKKMLAPLKEGIIDSKRDRFLRRRSIPRR